MRDPTATPPESSEPLLKGATRDEFEGASLFSIATTLLRSRWRIARWMLGGAILAALSVISRQPAYKASASFATQSTTSTPSGLRSLAGQFGVSVPTGGEASSPDFYARLLKSRVLLLPIVYDTITVAEEGGKRIPFMQLAGITEGTPAQREQSAVLTLKRMVTVTIDKTTEVVDVSAISARRSVSLQIVTKLIDGINEYNQRTRQSRAVAERKFVEGRLAIASEDLRDAETRFEEFLRNNRDIGGSPMLTLARDRFQRDVILRQQVVTALTQEYDAARIQEVHDTPVISVLEAPWASANPEPRGRVTRVLLGFFLGGLIGAMLSLMSGMMARRRLEGHPEVAEFVGVLGEIKGQVKGRAYKLRGRAAT
jgi:uncharacterized protein involved in exopolysaccharide biosynthesis